MTGAHGAIGSWLVRELVRRDLTVVGLDLAPAAATPFPELTRALMLPVDIRDSAGLGQVIREHRIGRIVHLAAALVGSAERDPALATEINALATTRLLDLAADLGMRRVVAMSTKGVLGALDDRYLHPRYEPVPVDLPPSPRGVYAATKLVVEVAIAVHRERGADVACVRLASTWGPGKSAASHGVFGLHSEVVAAALRGESSRLDLHPEQGFDLVYYADVAAGLANLVLAPGPLPSPVYHLGSGRITTIAEFAAAVEAAFPGVRVETGHALAGNRASLLDISLATRDAGYVPAWDVRRALDDVRDLAAAGIVGVS